MARLIPVADFIRELRSNGVSVDYWSLLDGPQEYWALLPDAARGSILGGEAIHGEDGRRIDQRVSVVRRRAKTPSIENVFLKVEWDGPGAPRPSLRNLLLYGPLSGNPIETPVKLTRVDEDAQDLEDFPVPQSVFREASWAQTQGSMMDLLDRAWGDETPYDLALDGPLTTPPENEQLTEIDSYWVDEPFAMVAILRNEDGELVYHVEEPRLSHQEKAVLVVANERLRDIVVMEEGDTGDRAEYVARKVFSLARRHDAGVDRRTAYKLAYYFVRNYLGFGRLDVIMRDAAVEDVSCNGPHTPIYVAHGKHRNLPTSLVFDELELNTFTVKLAQLGGKLLSVARPLIDATLPDGSRIQACLGREVTNRGSAFTIRKFREDPLTCVDLIRGGTHTVDTMALLWMAVEMKRSLIVMGATASGKTTTLNCISQFIPPTQKVVTIEDTREITLQHENWLAAITREAFTGSASERITMYDLLRAALRQRPEYLIVGEIRGEEGLTLFQAMSTGHTCFSTMHAGSVENAVHRLENPPIGVPRVMMTSLDMFLLQGQVDVNGDPKRRMLALTEVNGIDAATKNLRMNDIFRWDGTTDVHEAVGASQSIDQARKRYGWTRSRLDEEFDARRKALARLVDRDQRHYRDVAKAVWRFYLDRDAGAQAPALPPTRSSSGGATA